MNMTEEDSPIVEEVRRRAMKISRRFGHDPKRYLAHLQRIQRREKGRVVGQRSVVRADR